jgi:hypothetical protein
MNQRTPHGPNPPSYARKSAVVAEILERKWPPVHSHPSLRKEKMDNLRGFGANVNVGDLQWSFGLAKEGQFADRERSG